MYVLRLNFNANLFRPEKRNWTKLFLFEIPKNNLFDRVCSTIYPKNSKAMFI